MLSTFRKQHCILLLRALQCWLAIVPSIEHVSLQWFVDDYNRNYGLRVIQYFGGWGWSSGDCLVIHTMTGYLSEDFPQYFRGFAKLEFQTVYRTGGQDNIKTAQIKHDFSRNVSGSKFKRRHNDLHTLWKLERLGCNGIEVQELFAMRPKSAHFRNCLRLQVTAKQISQRRGAMNCLDNIVFPMEWSRTPDAWILRHEGKHQCWRRCDLYYHSVVIVDVYTISSCCLL